MPTLTISGTISFPLAGEATPPERPFSAQLIYHQRTVEDILLTGEEENATNLMGQILDAKAVYVEVIAGDAQLTVNAGTLDVSADGGFWVWFNPNGGLTELTASSQDGATLRVYVFA